MGTKLMSNKKNFILSMISGLIVSISLTLICILIFALLIRFFDIDDKWIFPINQIIKLFSICCGLVVVLKKTKEKGLVNGLIFGVLYFILNLIVFSFLQGSFSFNMANFYDMILTAISSGLIGMILVHIFK